MTRTTLLCILDGFGLNPNHLGNAVHLAKKPVIDDLFKTCPHTTLLTHGEIVGLPEGQMGNSEVGHMHIGAGRTVDQWLVRVEKSLKNGDYKKTEAYTNFAARIQEDSTIHLLGLLSDGGVHSHSNHLYALITELTKNYKNQIALHIITDGRDCDPNAALEEVQKLEEFISSLPQVKITTVQGRFFAMDRDQRQERTQKAFDAIVLGVGESTIKASLAIASSYETKITDEFIEPYIVNKIGVKENDSIIFFNFRADRMRQIVATLCRDNGFLPNTKAAFKADHCLCFTEYDKTLNLPFLFENLEVKNYLGEVLAQNNLRQLRVAETEKYPHVTYFLNAGNDVELPNENRILVPSPRDVKTYDLKPEMSAFLITDAVIKEIENDKVDVIVLNFANCDMVGHTGVVEAAIKAVETVDTCLGRILDALKKKNGQSIIIADHGNAEQLIDPETGKAHTAHTTFPVPMILWNAGDVKLKNKQGSLRDVAPTLLDLLNIKAPSEMTGESLLIK